MLIAKVLSSGGLISIRYDKLTKQGKLFFSTFLWQITMPVFVQQNHYQQYNKIHFVKKSFVILSQ